MALIEYLGDLFPPLRDSGFLLVCLLYSPVTVTFFILEICKRRKK